MQLTTIKQKDGIFIQLPKHIINQMQSAVSSFDDTKQEIHISLYPAIPNEIMQLSGSLNSHIGTATDEISDDEKVFLQALLDDDTHIKAGLS